LRIAIVGLRYLGLVMPSVVAAHEVASFDGRDWNIGGNTHTVDR